MHFLHLQPVMMKSSKMTMDKYSEQKLNLRAESLKVLMKKYGDIDPLKSKYSLKDIYECADEWTQKQSTTSGIVDYFRAYFSKYEGQEGS